MILIIITVITVITFGEILYRLFTNFIDDLIDTGEFEEDELFSFVFFFFLKTMLLSISATLTLAMIFDIVQRS